MWFANCPNNPPVSGIGVWQIFQFTPFLPCPRKVTPASTFFSSSPLPSFPLLPSHPSICLHPSNHRNRDENPEETTHRWLRRGLSSTRSEKIALHMSQGGCPLPSLSPPFPSFVPVRGKDLGEAQVGERVEQFGRRRRQLGRSL